MPIVFYKCSGCGQVGDLVSTELEYVQSKPHNYFWSSPARCEGRYTVLSTQQEWERQEGKPYPQELFEQYK